MIDRAMLLEFAKRFRRDERGSVAVYMALSSTVVMGGLGLAVETGFVYWQQREIQHVADAASVAAGVTKLNRPSDDKKAAILDLAKASGIKTLKTSDITINDPPQSGKYKTPPAPRWAIEVILQRETPRLFSAVFTDTPYIIRGRSVVLSEPGTGGDACILALHPSKVGAVSVTGSGDVTTSGCIVASNSSAKDSFDFVGANGKLHTECVRTVGTVDPGKQKGVESTQLFTECKAPIENSDPLADPYATRTIPTHPGSCPGADGTSSGGVTLHCGNWSPGSGTLSGTHIVRGGKMTINSTDVINSGSTGVTFIFEEGASVKINGGATLNLQAPKDVSAGDLKGLLFVNAKDNTSTMTINGTAQASSNGAFYNPGGKVDWSGNAAETGCPQLVASEVEFTGNSDAKITCPADPKDIDNGTTPIVPLSKVAVVE